VPKLYLRPRLPLHLLHLPEGQLNRLRGTHGVPRLHAMPETEINTILNHRKVFLGFVERRIADRAVAEDILQAAYMRALEREGDLQRNESVVGWFYRVLRNAVIDYYRRRSSEGKALELWSRELESAVVPPPEIQNEICACLLRVLDSIRPDYADLIRAVDLGEQPLQHFAREKCISASNAGVRAHRARAALRKQLVATCGSCAEHACVDCTCRR
jgi:RNA polymerase sigma factor (sigma-70 family)